MLSGERMTNCKFLVDCGFCSPKNVDAEFVNCDVSFIPAGAMAYKRDLPRAEIHLIDAGHFALVSNAKDILHYMLPFLQRNLGKGQHY